MYNIYVFTTQRQLVNFGHSEYALCDCSTPGKKSRNILFSFCNIYEGIKCIVTKFVTCCHDLRSSGCDDNGLYCLELMVHLSSVN